MNENPLMAYLPKQGKSNPLMDYLPEAQQPKDSFLKKAARFAFTPLVSEKTIKESPVASVVSAAIPVTRFLSGVPRAEGFTPQAVMEEGVGEVASQTTPASIASYAAMAMKPLSKVVAPARKAALEKSAAKMYRNIIRPGKAEVKNIELRGKSLDRPFKLAAKEGIQIGQAEGKLDTRPALQQVAKRIDDIDTSLTDILKKSKAEKQYVDLKRVATDAKRAARAQTANDTVYKELARDIDDYINDAIEARARYVSAADLNEVKRGMYSVGYNVNKPTSDKAARLIGKTARKKIEAIFPDENISKINSTLGDYLTLKKLLEGAHGRVVSGGRLGSYFAQTIGAGAGIAAGSPVPYVGPAVGAMAGRGIGKKLYEAANLPSRLSRIAAKKGASAARMGSSAESKLLQNLAAGLLTTSRGQ